MVLVLKILMTIESNFYS